MAEFTKGPWEVRRALVPSDGGYDWGVIAEFDGHRVCIAEAFARVGLIFLKHRGALEMATMVPRDLVIGNFKRSRREKLKAKIAHDPRAEREGNDAEHLANIRKLVCCTCPKVSGLEAHHLKLTGQRGMGMRSPDKFAIPLCHECHIHGVERVGSKNELNYFSKRGIEALDLAAALWSARGDLPKMMRIVIEHKAAKVKP